MILPINLHVGDMLLLRASRRVHLDESLEEIVRGQRTTLRRALLSKNHCLPLLCLMLTKAQWGLVFELYFHYLRTKGSVISGL
jgi:hypothetical protein